MTHNYSKLSTNNCRNIIGVRIIILEWIDVHKQCSEEHNSVSDKVKMNIFLNNSFRYSDGRHKYKMIRYTKRYNECTNVYNHCSLHVIHKT